MNRVPILSVCLLVFGLASAGAQSDQTPPKLPKVETFCVPEGSVPTVEIVRDAPPAELGQRARTLENQWACKACEGKAELTKEKRVGWERGGTFKKPIMESYTEPCPSCKATGFTQAKSLHAMFGGLTRAFSRIDTKAANAKETIDRAERALKVVTKSRPSTITRDLINDPILDAIAAGESQAGQPMFVMGTIAKDQPIDADAPRSKLVWIPGLSNADSRGVYVLITNPVASDALAGEQAIVGGIFAGFMRCADGSVLPVLQDGYAYTLDR